MSELDISKPMSESDIKAYYAGCKEKIDAGLTVWVRRNFDAEHGEVYDLFSDGAYLGYIGRDGDDNTWEAYRQPKKMEEGPQKANSEPIENRPEAEQALLASVGSTH